MAGDWIKMRVGLRSDPHVLRMARHLAADPEFMAWRHGDVTGDGRRDRSGELQLITHLVVSGLLTIWGWANEHMGDDELIPLASLADLDLFAEIPGFGAALAAVGWVDVLPEGLHFADFAKHNSTVSSRSKSGAERTRAWRERKKAAAAQQESVTASVTSPSATDQTRVTEEKRSGKARSVAPATAADPNPPSSAPTTPGSAEPELTATAAMASGLRGVGVVVGATDPIVRGWVRDHFSVEQLVLLAQELTARHPGKRLATKYLDATLRGRLADAQRRRRPPPVTGGAGVTGAAGDEDAIRQAMGWGVLEGEVERG